MTTIIKLSEKEIAEQKNYAAKYNALIQKELSYKDLMNLENVAKYTKAYQYHCKLAQSGQVEIGN